MFEKMDVRNDSYDEGIYYIYIDTKIAGAIKQLSNYFKQGVFSIDDCINVVCKHYKGIDKVIEREFNKNKIPFVFIKKQSDIKLRNNKVVLYPFNAQSNCKIVAFRNLTHIFVTHGDSHKLASVKPIIRIYDYIVSAGRVGIERYLKAGIFSENDIQEQRVITLGNTFTGDTKFRHNPESKCILYAPTWEGGIPSEDYSSVNMITATKITDFCKKNGVTTIFIQKHPNLGHRDVNKIKAFQLMKKIFKKNRLLTIDICENKEQSLIESIKKPFKRKLKLEVCYAFTDISAMEMQFIYKKIPYSIFINNIANLATQIPKSMTKYYESIFIRGNDHKIEKCSNLNIEGHFDLFYSYHDEEIKNYSLSERVKWLCSHTRKLESIKKTSLNEKY